MTNDWSVNEFLDKASGKVYRRYTYKRKPCIRVVLNSKLSQQLAGWTLIEKDLRNVGVWLKEIESRHKEVPKRKGESFGHSRDRETYNLIKVSRICKQRNLINFVIYVNKCIELILN